MKPRLNDYLFPIGCAAALVFAGGYWLLQWMGVLPW